MGWSYSYTCSRLGVTFNQGDTIYIKGTGYTSTDKSSVGYTYGSSTAKRFYGVFSAEYAYAPICVMDDYGNPQYFFEDSAIQSGGWPSTGNFVAYVKDQNRKGGTVNSANNGWFESVYLDWNSFGGGGQIKTAEVWYRESSDGSTWSDRVRVANISTTNNYGNYTIGSVNQTTANSNWGNRGKYYQWSVVIVTNSGTHSSTSFWSATRRKCTVTTYSFNANGGSGAPSTQYKHISYNFVFPTTKPTRTGYTFAGWSQSGSTTKYSAGQNVTGLSDSNITWYAQWTINSYKLTVNPNGGTWNSSTSSQSFTQNYGTTKTIANPTRSGYRFTGWTKSGTGTLSGTTFTFGAGACTLTANWVAVYYLDLNIYLNGATISGSNTSVAVADVYIDGSKVSSGVSDYYKQHDTGTKYEIKNIVVKSGYTKYSNSTLSGTLTAATSVKIYIGQNYTITYKSNGGSGSDQTQGVYYGASWTTKGAVFSREGYTLSSWNTAANGSGTTYSLSAAQTNKQTANVTLYAQWTANTYTNTIAQWLGGFKNQEGNNSSKSYYRLGTTTFTQRYNTSFVMNSSRAITVPNGCYLNNTWGTSYISGEWANYDLGTSVTQKASALSCDYYYYPTENTITYNLGGGTNNENNPSSYNVLYGISLMKPKKDGYVFLGWNAETDLNTITMNADDATNANYNFTDIIPGLRANPGVTYTITIGSATLTSGTATEFASLIYDFTSNIALATVTTSFGSNRSYTITCPSNVDASHKLRIIIYAGINGSTAGNSVKYTNAKIKWPITDINAGENASFTDVNDLYTKLDSRIACNLTLTANWHELTAEEQMIYIYDTGICEAVEFNENDNFLGFQKGGKVNSSQFVEGSNVVIDLDDNSMHFSEIKERF